MSIEPIGYGQRAYFATLLLVIPASAFAYVDPNVGGILFQILLPVLLAIAAAWSYLKRRLRALGDWFLIRIRNRLWRN